MDLMLLKIYKIEQSLPRSSLERRAILSVIDNLKKIGYTKAAGLVIINRSTLYKIFSVAIGYVIVYFQFK